jgi:hypothetical protein
MATMDARQVLDCVSKAKADFGVKCGKYAGAVMVEVLRAAIRDAGYNVSPRDSFIRGVPLEVDLLVARPSVEPRFGCLYEPSDVLVAIEIKNSGSFTESGIETTRANFEKIRQVSAGIRCCYVTLTERETYKWRVTSENLGHPYCAFTIFWHKGSKNIEYQETGDWNEFLDWLARERP